MKWMPMTGLCRLCRVVLGVEVLLVVHSLLSIEESQIDAFDVTKIIYKLQMRQTVENYMNF